MTPNPYLPEQLSRICEMGREPTEAVSRVLLRLDLLESEGSRKFEYFREINEIKPWSKTAEGEFFLLHPEGCMCAATFRIQYMNSFYCEVWVEEIFIAHDKFAAQNLAKTKRLDGPAS